MNHRLPGKSLRMVRTRSLCAASPSLIWVRELQQSSATLMADGGETPDSSRPLILSGTLAPRSDDRRVAGASRGHQWNRAEARTGGHESDRLLLRWSKRQPGLIAELAQGVVATADQLARH